MAAIFKQIIDFLGCVIESLLSEMANVCGNGARQKRGAILLRLNPNHKSFIDFKQDNFSDITKEG